MHEAPHEYWARRASEEARLALRSSNRASANAHSELARSLSEDYDALGIIRRGEHVTVLIRQRSTRKPGEWLGRLVLGYEDGRVRIFGASIF